MARARNIKPGFFTNDTLAEIHPLGRLLFAALWTMADREGRLEDRPKKIKAEALPYDNANVDRLLSDLQERGFIIRYAANGTRYIQVAEFSKHQNPHKNEAPSSIPPPEGHRTRTRKAPEDSGASTVQAPAKDGTTPADSLFLDSLSLDSGSPRTGFADQSGADPPPPAPAGVERARGSLAEKACEALRSAGVSPVNPSKPELAELLSAGVTPKQLGDLALELAEAKGEVPRFAYVLATMAGRLRDAAAAPASPRSRSLPYPAEFVGWERDESKTVALSRWLGLGDGHAAETYDALRGRMRAKLQERQREVA